MAASGGYGWKAVRHRWDDALSRMDPLAFERLVADYFRREGYRVEHVGTGGRSRRYDGGIDMKLYRDEGTIVVQCKRWTAAQVTHTDMHQLVGVMHTAGATGAILVNSGEFSRYALEMAARVPALRLIDGVELRRLLGDALPASATPSPHYALSAPVTRPRAGSVTYGSKDPESAFKDLLAFVITAGLLLLALRMCSGSDPEPTRPAFRTEPTAIQATPPPAPPIQSIPTEPRKQSLPPAQPVPDKRYYQTPDEAMETLAPNTPEV